MTAAYEVYAIKYAHHERTAAQNFLGGDPHDGPMPMDYFVWLVRGQGLEIVVDTGFGAATAARRQRQLLRPVDRALALLEVDAASVRGVVITHLHYDHAGCFDLFPRASFHLQDLEMQFATGRNMGEGRPFPIVYNVGDMMEGWGRLRALADSPGHIIPGHDPEVLKRYPAPSEPLEGVVARLD